MADVSGRAAAGGRERGQVLLVGGLAVAVAFVALALVLNSVIFTENLATRDATSTLESGVEGRAAADDLIAGTVRRINVDNEANATHATLASDLRDATGRWADFRTRQAATGGGSTALAVDSAVPGWRIRQTNASRNFTAGGSIAGQDTWRLAAGVPETAVFEMNLSRSSLSTAAAGTTRAAATEEAFHVAVDEPGASGFWRVYIFQGATTQQTYLLVEEPDEEFQDNVGVTHAEWATTACGRVNLDHVRVDVDDALMAGQPCQELRFFQSLNESYDVYYNDTMEDVLSDGPRVRGTYELFVNTSTVDHTPYYAMADGRSPFTQTAISTAFATYGHETDRVDYEAAFESHPARVSLQRGVNPEFDTTRTSYTDNGDGSYTVDWRVTDDDGDLAQIDVYLYYNDSTTDGWVEIDNETDSTIGGPSASGSTSVSGTLVDGTEVTLYATVQDDNGGGDTWIETDEVD